MTRPRSLFRKAKDYITYDLVEIIAPRSIPNPPGYVPPRKRSLSEVLQNVYKGTKLYFDSWSQEKIDRHLAEHYGEDYIKEKAEKETSRKEWQELVEGFGDAAKGGGKAMVPFLQNLYTSRAAAYGQALRQFVTGYREGIAEGVPAPQADPTDAAGESQQAVTQPSRVRPGRDSGDSQPETGRDFPRKPVS
ncbi:hypothetical protein ACKKBG_A38830 [Auxenochlorella protothecoides x Auxenochlorella symbiontica]